MERLTDKHFNKTLGYYMKCSGCCERSIACNECEEFEALVDRLGAIEEILGDGYDLDRLRELVEADRDGRCVVLLSNDDVYTIRGDILNGIIKANCRDACKPPKSDLKGDQHG